MTDTTERRLSNAEFRELGKLFAQELEMSLGNQVGPTRLPATWGRKLVERGLAEPCTFILPGRFPVRIEGHVLTNLGQMLYCLRCAEEPDEEETGG